MLFGYYLYGFGFSFEYLPKSNYILVLVVAFGIVASIMIFKKLSLGWYIAILMFITDIIYNLYTLYDSFVLGSVDSIIIILKVALVLCAGYFIFLILSKIKSEKTLSQ